MAAGPRYYVQARRRREGRTDYYQRMHLIVSEKPRMVVRKTNRTIIVQMVVANPDGDQTLVTANSRELVAYGFHSSTSSTPAAYLTGLLFARRALKAGYPEAVLDVGLHRASRGARVFAALKGAVKGGLDIPYSEEILPDDARTRGEHIAAYAPERAKDIVAQVANTAEAITKEVA